MAWACRRKCRNGWRKNSELSMGTLLLPHNLQTSQAGSWLAAHCLQCCRAQGQGRAPEVARRGGDKIPFMVPLRVNLQQASKLHIIWPTHYPLLLRKDWLSPGMSDFHHSNGKTHLRQRKVTVCETCHILTSERMKE